MSLKQRAELVWRHADDDQDVPQGAFGHVATRMDGNRNRASIRMLHDVVATGDPRDGEPRAFERLYDLRSRYDWDATRHKSGRYYNSGDVECQSEFVGYPDLFDQQFKPGPQIRDRLFLRRAIADSANARAEQGRGAPYTIFVLLDGVGHVNDASHTANCVTHVRNSMLSCRSKTSTVGTSRDVLSYSRRKEHANPKGVMLDGQPTPTVQAEESSPRPWRRNHSLGQGQQVLRRQTLARLQRRRQDA